MFLNFCAKIHFSWHIFRILSVFSVQNCNFVFCISGEVNGGFVSDSHSLNGSRKSLANMPSVMMVPHFQMPPNVAPPQPPPTPGGTLPPPEQYSDGQGVPPPYGSYPQPQMQNFQL